MGIRNFENWTKVTKGYYRYVVAAKACYELLITYQDDDPSNTEACLYITGDWLENSKGYFSRDLLFQSTLDECLDFAGNDYRQGQDMIS